MTGVLGAVLLAALALLRRDSLKVPREIWPRLLTAALLNVTGWMVLMGLALLWLPASEAALIAYTMPVWASIIAWPVLGERPTVLRQLVRFSLPGRFALPPVRYFRMYQPEAKAFQGDGKTASYPFKVE